uniref:Uncharacterized protein n=1 Tax=Rhizophora mucronata TaxID=61149 RepID=A0A2P2QTM6_RHIMU
MSPVFPRCLPNTHRNIYNSKWILPNNLAD